MKINKTLFSLAFLTLSSMSTHADELKIKTPPPASKLISPKMGIQHFETQIFDERDRPAYGEILVTNKHGKLLQSLAVEIWIFDPHLEFLDINDDGNMDLLFYNSDAGMCCGATQGADVYIFSPKLKKFVKSKTLSGQGGITKTKAKGCVNINYKSSLGGYTDDKWCFNLKTGLWRMIKSTSNEPTAN
jgi:hypothetical protein